MPRSLIIWLPIGYAAMVITGVLLAGRSLQVSPDPKDFWTICTLIVSVCGTVLSAFVTLGAISAKFEADRSLEHIKETIRLSEIHRQLHQSISSEVEILYSCMSQLQRGDWNNEEFLAVDKKIESIYYQADELEFFGLFDRSSLHRFHHCAYTIAGHAEEAHDAVQRRDLWVSQANMLDLKYSQLKAELERCRLNLAHAATS